uniref:Cell cycle checkpoint control protein RAD9A n=1 Tax=Romanomermis culicivorax TaxID=13658 RepID=A0A915ISL8_ROMCU
MFGSSFLAAHKDLVPFEQRYHTLALFRSPVHILSSLLLVTTSLSDVFFNWLLTLLCTLFTALSLITSLALHGTVKKQQASAVDHVTFEIKGVEIIGRAIYALAKLPGDELYFDAQDDGLFLRSLNSCRSAFCSFRFSPLFFMAYVPGDVTMAEKTDGDATNENRCKIPAKSALMVYKIISSLEKSIELAEIMINVKECRLVFRLMCKYGVVRTYKFILIECDTVETLYDRTKCEIQLVAPATLLLDAVQTNFKGGLEDLTLNASETELLLTNCLDDEPDPDKCVKTVMRLNADEFDKFLVCTPAEVTFCLKELRAFLTFIEVFRLPVSIYFDHSGKPAIFALESDPNFMAELILATYLVQDSTTVKIDQIPNSQAALNNTSAIADYLHNNSSNIASTQNQNRIYRRKNATDSIRVSDCRSSQETTAVNSTTTRKKVSDPDNDAAQKVDSTSINEAMDTFEKVSDRHVGTLHSPPSKKARHFLLIKGWSQTTMISADSPTSHNSEDVLAPDSDLEDH